MSNSKQRRSGCSKQLYRALHKMMAAEQTNNEREGHRWAVMLYQQLELLIEQQNDDALFNALNCCTSREEIEQLFEIIELECETLDLMIATSDDHTPALGDALLFAIPIIAPAAGLPDTLDTETLNALTKSLRNFGLIDKFPTVMLLPNIYSAQQLTDLPLTQRKDLLEAIVNQAAIPVPPAATTDAPFTNRVELSLRFLVGCLIGDEVMFNYDDSTDQRQLDDWHDFVKKTLGDTDEDLSLFVPPMPFGTALRNAINIHNKMAVDSMLALTKYHRHLDLSLCSLVVESVIEREILLVTLLDSNGSRQDVVALSFPSPMPQDLEQLAELIAVSAQEADIGSLKLVDNK